MICIFYCVFTIQGGSWLGLRFTIIKPTSIWKNSKWNIYSSYYQLQGPQKQLELHFGFIFSSDLGDLSSSMPLAFVGQKASTEHGKRQFPSPSCWLVEKKSYLADKLWPWRVLEMLWTSTLPAKQTWTSQVQPHPTHRRKIFWLRNSNQIINGHG